MKKICLLPLLFLAGCNTKSTSWDPASVQPPESLTRALEAADAAAEKRERSFPALDADTTLTLTRDGAVLTALARNRSLRVERFSPDISRELVTVEEGAWDPKLLATVTQGRSRDTSRAADETYTTTGDATLQKNFDTGTALSLTGALTRTENSNEDAGYGSDLSARVSQSLLRGGNRTANRVALRQAENTAESSNQALRASVITLVQQVEDAYWELILALETIRIREGAVKVPTEQVRLALARKEIGSAVQLDLLSAQSERAARDSDLIAAKAAAEQRRLELIRLLSPQTPVQWQARFDTVDSPEIAELSFQETISAELGKMYRPDLAQSRLELANRELSVIQTRDGLLPKLDGFASYGRQGTGSSDRTAIRTLQDNRADQYQLGLDYEVNLNNRAAIARERRAKFQQKQAEASIENLEEKIELDVRQAIIEARQQWDQHGATLDTLKSRRAELDAAQQRLRAERGTLLDVFQFQNNLVQAELAEVTSRVRYIQAITQLYAVEGTLLDRRGVGVDGGK